MSERAHHKAWAAHAQEAAAFALDRPEQETTWSAIDRAEYAALLAGVLATADQHDAARRAPATRKTPPGARGS